MIAAGTCLMGRENLILAVLWGKLDCAANLGRPRAIISADRPQSPSLGLLKRKIFQLSIDKLNYKVKMYVSLVCNKLYSVESNSLLVLIMR